MAEFLTEDQITDIFADYLIAQKWEILTRAKGRSRGADIVAKRKGKTLCVEAKGGGSQSPGTRRYGQAFTRLQCQSHTDVAFACVPRMMARYKPRYVGIVLPDDDHYYESVSEILPAIKALGAGLWLVGPAGVRMLSKPKLQNII